MVLQVLTELIHVSVVNLGWLEGSASGDWVAFDWGASSLLSSSKLARTCSQGHGKGPRDQGEAARLLEA